MRYTEDDLAGKKIVITGGAGFIGSNLAFYFQDNHPNASVTVFDRFQTGERFPAGNLKSFGHYKNLVGFKGEVIAGDINNKEDLERIAAGKFDIIFHQAAISDTTVEDQELMLRSNLNAFTDILRIARENNARVIYASSAGTYGNSAAPNRIGSGELPENVYGFSKLMMDNSAARFVKDNPGMHVVGLRYFNVYGPREYYKATTASMILQLGLQALRNKKVRLFKYGEQKRDFVYVGDVVQANVKALFASRNGVFNAGSGVARSFNDILAVLRSEIGEFEVEYFDNPYTFYQNYTEADISDSKACMGYDPGFSLEEGIRHYAGEIREIYSRTR